MENRKLVNILDEIRDRLYLTVEYCSEHELDVWEHYFLPLKEKDEQAYEAFLKTIVSDCFEFLTYIVDCGDEDVEDDQKELLEAIKELETFDHMLIEIETNQDFFDRLLLQFSNKYEYRKGYIVGAFNYVFNHYFKQMQQLNHLYIYEVNYATIMGYTYRNQFRKQDFINIYEYLERLEQESKKDEEYNLNEEFELFLMPMMNVNPMLFTDALHSMIESFYVYCTIGKTHGYIKEDSKEMELYQIIEEGNYRKVFTYLNEDPEALHLLFTCFHAYHLSNIEMDLEEFQRIADDHAYSRVKKMIHKNEDMD